MVFTEEQRAALQALTERKKKAKRMKDVRAHEVKTPSVSVIFRQFKTSVQVLNSLSSALKLAGHTEQARDIDHLRGQVQGVQKQVRM